ncbi:H-type lectin domain-containing protein [Micromonospora sp. NPDC049051]|uniref:H-type lectin domain-containing protein n=1 Tax=Micromonospora sp. NPDC049051 TaxID=3364264 RepID=UPI00371CB115
MPERRDWSRRNALRLGAGGVLAAAVGAAPLSIATSPALGATAAAAAGPFNPINIFTTPAYVNDLDTPLGTVSQCAVKDTSTGDWYVSEPTAAPAGTPSDCIVSRHRADGTLVSSMRLTQAGHGTSFALQHDGATLYVWLAWTRTGGSQLVRIPYAAGATRPFSDAQVINKFSTMYTIPAIDEYNDLMTFRGNRTGFAGDVLVKRRLSEVTAGIDNILAGPIDVPWEFPNNPGFQGFCDYGDTFFMLYGASDGSNNVLKEFRWSDGTLARPPRDISAVGGATAYHEPEGISLFRDATGRATLTLGIVDKVNGAFRRRLFSWTESGDVMNQDIQTGKRVVQVGSSTDPVETPVAFKTPFDSPPVVLVSQSSGANSFYHVGAKYVTQNGFTLIVNKSGPTGATAIRAEWAALPNTGG